MSSQCIWRQILIFSFIIFLKVGSLFLQSFIVRDILVQQLRRLEGRIGPPPKNCRAPQTPSFFRLKNGKT